MALCYPSCKHYCLGFCAKYNEFVYVSAHPMQRGIPLHPLNYLSAHYDDSEEDTAFLMDIADKCLDDSVAKSICKQYKSKGSVTYKQRRYVIWEIFNCYEPETVNSIDIDDVFIQVD